MSAKIASALHAVMQDVPYVQRTGKNTFHNYRYAGEADLLEKLRPALIRHGLILIPSIREVVPPDQHGNVTVLVDYTLLHKDGDMWPEKIKASGCGNDRSRDGKIGDKGLYKALTGANKYLLFKLFQIETGDDPEKDERPAPAEVSDSQKNAVRYPVPDGATLPPHLGYDPRASATMPSSAPQDSRSIYVKKSLEDIELFDDPEKLAAWLDQEAEIAWPDFGITKHDPDGHKILMACKKKNLELKQPRAA
jgi:hypothetical protein